MRRAGRRSGTRHFWALLGFTLLVLAATSARAGLVSLAASGTITANSSGDPAIPIGSLWAFELVYDTAAPDLDFELAGSPDPTFGRFTNTGATPALIAFHYRAGSYEVTIDDPDEFGVNSEIHTTFTSIHAIDININAPGFFPPLAGGAVSFHADFNDFSSDPIFTSDALPKNSALSADNFDASSVTLLPPASALVSGDLTSLTLTAVAEPPTAALSSVALLLLLAMARRGARLDVDETVDDGTLDIQRK